MENVDDVIILPWELERNLPTGQRNLVKVLCNHPKGLYSYELFALIGNKNPSSARYSSKHVLAQYGLEINCEPWARKSESFWIIQRIKPAFLPETEIQKNDALELNKKAWSWSWPANEDGYLDINNFKLSSFEIENSKQLSQGSMEYCFKTAHIALGAAMTRLTEIMLHELR